MYEVLTRELVAKFDLQEDYRITCVGIELEEIDGAGSDLPEAIQMYEEQGYLSEAGLEKALQERVVVSRAPEGYAFVRLEAKRGPAITVMVPNTDI
jgi:hypothetical protein